MNRLAAKDVIYTLGMERHPEGGWYAETLVDVEGETGRAQSTAIYYLLEAGDLSHWHRVDAVEVWHYYAGAPIELSLSDGITLDRQVLGSDLAGGQRPQVVVPRDVWQSGLNWPNSTEPVASTRTKRSLRRWSPRAGDGRWPQRTDTRSQ